MRIISLDYERAILFFKRLVLVLFTASVAQSSFAANGKKDAIGCEEILKALTTVSFNSVFEDVERHPALPELRAIFVQRTAAEQKMIDAQLTENHLRKEMSFQTRNPETGMYDKFVAVPVNGRLAPIMKADYDRMVRSTGPVLRALRSLLQKAYSQKEWTVASLGLQDLPESEAAIVLKVLRESIYMEPALNAPAMSGYPFLPVSGFDGAIVDPKKPQNVFFEMNLGTPSGLANNADLLDDLETTDPAAYNAVHPYLPNDKTFTLLRDTIERNARAWTGGGGISVVISPGIYNGAHPDVAAIARRTGMPLVKSSDLYEDANGQIRLNGGDPLRDPVVTGIYDRMEESFFLQSSEEKIPLISPQYENQSALEAKTGVKLRPGAIYKWTYGEDGKIDGVEKDAAGNPLLEEVWNTIGKDPRRPDAPRGSFARSVRNRRLYVSNIGGRLVDDKRLFRIVSQYMAKRVPGTKVAGPVLSLSPNNLGALFRNPDDFVVKAPANSGGVGIHFLRTMKAEEKQALLQQLREKPGDFEVQYVSPIATLPQAFEGDFADVAIDLRIFVMMNELGEVDAGANSVLLRTAPPGGLYSNTSRGGGYGIAVVLEKNSRWWRRFLNAAANSYYPQNISEGQRARATLQKVKEISQEIDRMVESEEIHRDTMNDLRERALELSFDLREHLHLLTGPMASLPSYLRDFTQNPAADESDLNLLARRIEMALHSLRNTSGVMGYAFYDLQRADYAWWDRLVRRMDDPTGPSYSSLNLKIKYRKLEEPVVAYYWDHGGEREEKYEMAEIVAVEEPAIQEMIDLVKAHGGEVRLMKTRLLAGEERRFVGWRYQSPYFWVNLDPTSKSYLKPVIGIDLTGDRAIAAMKHEMEHFKIWLESYQAKRALGMEHEAAVKAAVDHVWERDMIVYGERRAVEAEMQAERDFPDSPFNQSSYRLRPTNFWEKGYLNRIIYPEFEAVRQVLHENVNLNRPLDTATLRKYMTVIVQKSLELRTQALKHIEMNPDPLLRDYWENHTISALVTQPYGHERLSQQKTALLFDQYLDDICKELTGGTARCR